MFRADNGNGTFTNPVIFADYPDPDIIRVGSDFYMASSSFTSMPGIPICHSTDLVNWRIIGHAYEGLFMNPMYSMAGGSVAYRGGSWAPSIRHRDGLFYICFCTPAEGFFMCISARPEGPYEMIAFGEELYDPGLFFDDNGRVYVAHGANTILITELSSDARSVKQPGRIIYQTAYGTPFEGSHMYKRGRYNYICCTCRGYNGIQVCLRSREIYGRYESRLLCADDMNYAGAGLHQGGFVELENGETWFFLFQNRDYIGRVPVLQRVTWVDDWPLLGDPENYWKAEPTCRKPSISTVSAAVGATEGTDEFESPSLSLQWHWNHNPDNTRWSLSERAGYLRLKAGYAPDFTHARNTLTQKIVGPESTATARIELAALETGDVAGLAVFGIPYAYIGVVQEEGCRKIVMVNDGRVIQSIAAEPHETIFLRVHAGSESLAFFHYGFDNEPFLPLGEAFTMQFTVKTFLGNKFGLFCYNSIAGAKAGHADFDYLRIDAPKGGANNFSAFEQIPATRYDAERGTDTQRPVEKMPHQYLIDINEGDWVRFDHVDFGEGAELFEVHASAVGHGGSIELKIGSLDGPSIGTCEIPATGNQSLWSKDFRTTSSAIDHVKGVRTLYLVFHGKGRYVFRLDWFRFHETSQTRY